MEPIRWGILSTAEIGVAKVIPAIQRSRNGTVVAIASRDAERARAAAGALAIPASYGNYADLLAADDIDAVYIPLPNDQHAEWSVKAARAGKHVLCEKPMALSAEQAQGMVDACSAEGVLLQEAFMYRHHPTWVEVARRVRAGELGDLEAVQTWFGYFNDDPNNIRNRTENGGGAMLDVGCYAVSVARLLFGQEPVDVAAAVRRDPRMGIDTLVSGVLTFPGGGQSSFTVGTRSEPYQRVHVVGTRGRIEVEIPFNIPPDLETRIFATAGGDAPVSPNTTTVSFTPADQYTLQAELFSQAILDGSPTPVPPADAVANMAVIDAVLAH